MCTLGQWSPALLAPGTGVMEDNFPRVRGGGDRGGGLGMIQVYNMYCALYFHNYYKSSTSDPQTLDPRGWGPLP